MEYHHYRLVMHYHEKLDVRTIEAMRKRHEPLINPTSAAMWTRDPLICFSWYLSGRKNCVLELGDEVVENLDAAFSGDAIDGGALERAEMLMWFWVLGAYEIVRTMCQAKECFTPILSRQLEKLKKELAYVRMPAAKMEEPGNRKPVTSNRSPFVWDLPNRDILIGNPMSLMISARGLLSHFQTVVLSITPADILRRHEDSYDGKA